MADLGQLADTYKAVKGFVGLGKKKKKRKKPSSFFLIGDFNLKNSPLSSKRSFFVPTNSAKSLRSKVNNGKRI